MPDLASLNRSYSLDSAGNDFVKYAKLVAAARGKIGDVIDAFLDDHHDKFVARRRLLLPSNGAPLK
jgi:hypothetical protein